MRAAVLLAEFVLRQRERLCSHGHRLHVLLERFGLLEDVLSGVLVGRLGLAEIAARVIVDAFRLVLSCTCFGDVLGGLAGSVALLLGVSVFRQHILHTAPSDASHLLYLVLYCVLGGRQAFVEHQRGHLSNRIGRSVGPGPPPALSPLPLLRAALPRVIAVKAALCT